MKGLKKKRRIQVIVLAAVALAASTAIIGYAMRDGINFFRSPSQVAEAGVLQLQFAFEITEKLWPAPADGNHCDESPKVRVVGTTVSVVLPTHAVLLLSLVSTTDPSASMIHPM